MKVIKSNVGLLLFNDQTDHKVTDKKWEQLESYKMEFLTKLAEHCETYRHIGFGTSESPMWFQYRGTSSSIQGRDRLDFRSSQRNISFRLVVRKPWNIRHEVAYDYFKNVKYDYLKKHEPSIYNELKPY